MADTIIKVLLVEDNPVDARLVQEYLSECRPESYELHCESRLATAVECIRRNDFDVLLLDLTLPDSSGLETVTEAHAAAPDLPMIVITGMEDERLAQMALQSGAQDYLVKGAADPSTIQRSIRYAISRVQTLRALRASEERYALAAEAARDGLWDWSLESNNIYFSPRWKSMLGFEADEIADKPEAWFDLIHADEIVRVRAELNAHLQGQTSHFESEHRMRHRDGSYRWVLTRGLAVRNGDGNATRIAGSQSDITARKAAVESLRHNAFHDQLTGVANQALFLDRLEHALVRRRGGEHALAAVLCLGLDRFKVINESLGHAVGDQVLKEAATRLQRCLRAEDTLARTGGDRFMVLVEEVADIPDSLAVAARLQENLLTPFVFDGQEVFTSASIGIICSIASYQRPEECVRDAEIAMHRAKSAGGERRELFDRAMHEHAVARLRLEQEMRHGIDRQEFGLHYQPITSLTTGGVVAFEALLRWQHPERGTLAPAEFLDLAESTGLLIPIFRSTLALILEQIHRWHEESPRQPPIRVNINLSRSQLASKQLLEDIDAALRNRPVPDGSVAVEVTESVIMEDPETAKELLKALKTRGFQLYLDDFGTGYSSLSSLHLFPFDDLKVDRSFVSGVSNPGRFEIVRAIVTLGHALGMTVTAEGIETADQLNTVRKLGCNHAQGYFLGRPVPADEAGKVLADSRGRETT